MLDDKVTFDDVRSIAADLADVKVAEGPRGIALKIKGRILACRAIHSSAEPDSLMLCLDPARRDALLAENPDACYLTGHYASHSVILVRLPQISRADLSVLLTEATEFVRGQIE